MTVNIGVAKSGPPGTPCGDSAVFKGRGRLSVGRYLSPERMSAKKMALFVGISRQETAAGSPPHQEHRKIVA